MHWRRLALFLPPEKPRVGRPNHPHRRIINGMLWILATGAPWRDLPVHHGPWHTISSRFYRWRQAGIWARVLAALQRHADQQGQLDWSVHLVDSTIVRAHQHAAGARSGQSGEALGRSRGGFSTKIHVCADRRVQPLVLRVTSGERHDQTMFELLLTHGQVRREGRGRPRQRPRRVVGDKRNEFRRGPFDRHVNCERNRVEWLINPLKQFRRVATRYEKRATNYLAMVTVAAILLWT